MPIPVTMKYHKSTISDLSRSDIMKRIFPALIASLGLLVAGHAHANHSADEDALRFARWIHAGLLDPDAPMACCDCGTVVSGASVLPENCAFCGGGSWTAATASHRHKG